MDHCTRVHYLTDAALLNRLYEHCHELGEREASDVRKLARLFEQEPETRLSHFQRNWAEQLFCKLRLKIEPPPPQRPSRQPRPVPRFWWDGQDTSQPWNHPTKPPGRQ